jgi:single-strand DNA-binding protein
MSNGSSVTLVGNVTRDPELRFLPSGQAVANFGVAVNRSWRNKTTNEWEEATSFFDVVCYQQLAENASESIQRGSRIVVTGRLEQRSWETQEGEKRSKIEVVADEVGPSLRWATAVVTKNERKGPGGSGGDGAPGGGGGGPKPARNEPSEPGSYGYDEEPF